MSVHKTAPAEQQSVVHCFRAPVGGVFRHVRDLAIGQAMRGLNVGVICDATTGGAQAESTFEEMRPHCVLGVHRVAMRRKVHLSDVLIYRTLVKICLQLRPTIVHGHGAKGGAFARLLRQRIGAQIVYTPHGGVLHYAKSSLAGRGYFALERYLRRATDGVIFVSEFGRQKYKEKIGDLPVQNEVIHNGLCNEDFAPLPDGLRTHNFVFVGELRKLKGLDTLLEALVHVRRKVDVNLLVCGDGPDAAYFATRIRELKLERAVTLSPATFPVARAFAQARCVVIPSHAESFPYIVLEAAAASMPMIATSAGGIPEAFGSYAHRLVAPGDVDALATAMAHTVDDPKEVDRVAAALATHVSEHFRVESMLDASMAFYQRVLGAQR